MKVLITGAGGFAGQHVVSHLLKVTDWKLVIVSRRPVNFDSKRITKLTHDLRDPLSPSVFGYDVDAVINLASSSDVQSFLDDPVKHVTNNVAITLNMLQWARFQDLKVFIQVSTNEVYGPSDVVASKEWDPLTPSTPYSASKAAQEVLAIGWHQSFGIPTVIVNTMHLFGEGQPEARFVPTTIRRMLANESVPIYGQDPRGTDQWESSVRNWMYVGDFAHSLFQIIDRGRSTSGQVDRWNVAGPILNCEEVAEQVARRLGLPLSIEWKSTNEARPGYEHQYTLNTRSFKDFGYIPFYGFGHGMTRTVDWFREKIKREEN